MRAVVVHAGARDAYQLAQALSEAGLLEALVTDLYWPGEENSLNKLGRRFFPGLELALMRRSNPHIPFQQVRLCWLKGLRTLLLDKTPGVPFARRRESTRSADAALGKKAGTLAKKKGVGLVSYSYTGFDAIRTFGRPAMLFQAHPHPATMRRILNEELTAHPDCAASLNQEWELSLPEADYRHLVQETTMAQRYIVASTFTRLSLTEHGTAADTIDVVPYGVDLDRFRPASRPASGRGTSEGPLRLLFVGRINQRKGIKYLLEALRLLDTMPIHLTVCGRVVDDLALFKPFGSRILIRPSVNSAELVEAYQAADLFVFPSVAEGFGQVLLEALACGLPILSTTHTAAPDLIDDGVQGFVVPPRRPDLLAERIAWAATHRQDLAAMALAARERAELFTWHRFRSASAQVVSRYLATLQGNS